MKKKNKYNVVFFSGLILGILSGLVLAPSKGESIRSIILYRIKKIGNKFSYFILRIFKTKKFKVINEAKATGNEVIRTTRSRAKKLLDDIKTITDKK